MDKTYKIDNIEFNDSTKSVIEDMLEDDELKKMIKANIFLVEYGNFDSDIMDLSLVCGKVKKLYLEEDGVYADISFIETPFGKKVQSENLDDFKLMALCKMTDVDHENKMKSCKLVKLCLIKK